MLESLTGAGTQIMGSSVFYFLSVKSLGIQSIRQRTRRNRDIGTLFGVQIRGGSQECAVELAMDGIPGL